MPRRSPSSIRDQVVMVTGAGGSIGSELARQVYAFRPKQLVLVDRAESPLYMIQRELELRAHGRSRRRRAVRQHRERREPGRR